MLKPSWRTGRHAGAALALLACCSTHLPGSDLANMGAAAPAGHAVQNAVPPELVEAPPMYRLPAVDGQEEFEPASPEAVAEAPITPIDEPQSEPIEPLITILPPVDQTPVDETPVNRPNIVQLPPIEQPTANRLPVVTQDVIPQVVVPQLAAPQVDEPPLPALAAPLPSPELASPESQSPETQSLESRPPQTEPVLEWEPDANAPTITILPPPDDPAPVTVEEPTQPEDLEIPAESAPAEETAPAEPTAEMAAPTDNLQPPANEINNDFDNTWNNESVTPSPTPATEPPMENTPPLEPALEPAMTMAPPIWTPYSPTTAELSRQLLPNVRKAYGLAQHGAVYAAQTEFIQVLRRIAESKDAAEGIETHSRSLAAGLRALDEADDFAPKGAALEADVNVAVIASSHRTPVLAGEFTTTRPSEAIALYHHFARQQLTVAVAGEQAGSMALYGLGKVNNRLAREADGEVQLERKALTMFAAALDAGPGNHLAANEIGVLLARAGQPAAASEMFRRAIDIAPSSTAYHNLAVTDRTLGMYEQAAANEQYAFQLAQRDRIAGAASRAKGVQWVAPQELSRVAQTMPIEHNGQFTNRQMTNQQMANDRMATVPPQVGPQYLPQSTGPMETAAQWPQKLVPGIFRR